jgi:hypothetical protein
MISGRVWKGHFEQYGVRQELKIRKFKAKRGGPVVGEGKDELGEFTISGKAHSNGAVDFKKNYNGRHIIIFMGMMSENNSLIEGDWEDSGARGTFKIEV